MLLEIKLQTTNPRNYANKNTKTANCKSIYE